VTARHRRSLAALSAAGWAAIDGLTNN